MSLCRTTNTTNSPDNDNKDRRSFKQRDDDAYDVANVKERERERLKSILQAIVLNPTKVNNCLLVFYHVFITEKPSQKLKP